MNCNCNHLLVVILLEPSSHLYLEFVYLFIVLFIVIYLLCLSSFTEHQGAYHNIVIECSISRKKRCIGYSCRVKDTREIFKSSKKSEVRFCYPQQIPEKNSLSCIPNAIRSAQQSELAFFDSIITHITKSSPTFILTLHYLLYTTILVYYYTITLHYIIYIC